MVHISKGSTKQWWRARFKIKYSSTANPLPYTDLLLAHKIISPIIKEYFEQKNGCSFWRFHMRWEPKHGHKFDFEFFSTAKIKTKIDSKIQSSDILKELKHEGLVEHLELTELYDENKDGEKKIWNNVKDICDKNWSISIKKVWPAYIMSVSRMWLELIEICVDLPEYQSEKKSENLFDLLDFYKRIDTEKIERLWLKQGWSSLIHHLSAIFGYKEIQTHKDLIVEIPEKTWIQSPFG